MTTITREQQKQILIDTANHVISRDNTSPYSENLRELACIALASLEAEPIGAFHIADQQVGGTSDYIKDGEWPIDNGVIEVYAVTPVLVVPEERPSLNNGIVGFDEGWNACRAAMLQGSQPVSNHDELSYAQVKAVADLYALCWQSGEVVTYTPDQEKATIWLNNYSGTCVQEYVKLERLQEAVAANSPVILDGWIMVPKTATPEISQAINKVGQHCTCGNCSQRLWDMLLAAAPQPEVK